VHLFMAPLHFPHESEADIYKVFPPPKGFHIRMDLHYFPVSGSVWNRIGLALWIRIRIRIAVKSWIRILSATLAILHSGIVRRIYNFCSLCAAQHSSLDKGECHRMCHVTFHI
jgi:hypothetical protein